MGFLCATSDIDLELLQDFDLSEFEGLFGQSENNDVDNNSSSTSVAGGSAEGASQDTPTQPITNQEAENAEQPSEAQQVKISSTPAKYCTMYRTESPDAVPPPSSRMRQSHQ